MRFWQSLSPEQKQEGRNSFLRVAYNRYMRTKDPELGWQILAQVLDRTDKRLFLEYLGKYGREKLRTSGQPMLPKPQTEKLIGGFGDYRPDSDFDQVQLAKGIKVEMEHTNDPKVAKEIVHDHLSEDNMYYIKLAKMEKKSN